MTIRSRVRAAASSGPCLLIRDTRGSLRPNIFQPDGGLPVSLYLIHPHRSQEAFAALIEEWQGILVSDGYGVYQDWVNHRQTCLAHLIRTARGLSEKRDPYLAACGRWALSELQTLCHMAKAPPTVGQWGAWYARFCRLIAHYHERQDDAGRLARRLQR